MNRRLPTTFWICLPFTGLFFFAGIFLINRNTILAIVSFAAAAIFTIVANLSVAMSRPVGDELDED